MSFAVKYSFIIPVKVINDYVREAVGKILAIKREDYEIIVYPDEVDSESWPLTRQIATGHCGPAEKRSLAIRDAQGSILVFIDDDAYPENNFLEILDNVFSPLLDKERLGEVEIKAVGGPAITPRSDNFWQKVSGAVYLSSLSGANPERYVSIGQKKIVNDWPSVNFSIRKEAFTELNGFDSKFWPGEDTKLCLDLIKKYPDSIIYDPALIVYHHRRAGFFKHLKQTAGYGLHRGFFAKKYPATSFKFKYFIPSFFLLFVLFGGFLSFFSPLILDLYIFGWLLYLSALIKALTDILKYENFKVAINSIYYIFFTHLVYGFKFIQGFLFTSELKSKLR